MDLKDYWGHPTEFERRMDHVLCDMRCSTCLVYLDDVISFVATVSEALLQLEEILEAKKITFMQMEVAFRPGL